MLERLMTKYRVFTIKQLRQLATDEEVKEIDEYLLKRIRMKTYLG